MSQLPLVVLALLVSLALAAVLFGLRSFAARLRRKAIEVRRLNQKITFVEQELDFVLEFLSQLPRMSSELYNPSNRRKIPEALLEILARTFQPEQAAVLIRRRPALSQREQERQLVVAAVAPPSSTVRRGMLVSVGVGELGLVAQENRYMDRRELDQRAAVVRHGEGELEGLRVDFASPLRDREENLGVLAVRRPTRNQAHARELLELVGQLGAHALRQATEFSQIRSVADLDSLTGIFNKRVLNYKLGELVFEAESAEKTLAVFLFDIDNFKHYNDQNGHLAGDKLLRLLSRLVGELLRAEDIFGRFGGEEFLIILRDCTPAAAMLVADKIRAVVADYEFPFREQQPLGAVTVSGGVAAFPRDARSSTELLRLADTALYRAKSEGRNRVCEPDLSMG